MLRTRMDAVDFALQAGESLSTGAGLSSVYEAPEAKGEKSVSIMVMLLGGNYRMTKAKPTPQKIIRYWHPRKGGWYHAILIRSGRKWAIVESNWTTCPTRHRIPLANVRESVL